MADANYQVLVEFLSKSDNATAGINSVTKATDGVISKNKQADASFKERGNNAGQSFKHLGGEVKETSNTILNEWLGLGIALSGAGLLEVINKTAERIDALTDKARGLGVASSDLQKLGFGAKLGGVGLDELGGSLQKFNITVGKALSGNEDAINSFKRVGLSIDSLKGKDLSAQFALTATAAGKLEDTNLAAAAGAELFGRNYVTALNLGRDGITKNIEKFDELGVTLTDVQRKAVDEFGDAKTTLGTIFDGFLQKVTAEVSPALTKLVDQVNEYIKASGGIDKASKDFADGTVSAINNAVNAFTTVYRGLVTILDEYKKIKNGNSDIASGLSNPLSRYVADQISSFSEQYNQDNLKPLQFLRDGGQFSGYNPNIDNEFTRADGRVATRQAYSDRLEGIFNKNLPQILSQTNTVYGAKEGSQSATNGGIVSESQAVQTALSTLATATKRVAEQIGQSADSISGIFKSLADKDKTSTLTEIFNKINDEGLANPFTRTYMSPIANPNFTGGNSPFLEDEFGVTKYEKKNVFDTATGTQFEDEAAKFIGKIKSGGFNSGEDVTSILGQLRGYAIDNGNAGLNNQGEIEALNEIKKFAESYSLKTDKPQKVEITVSPSNDFIVKVAESSFSQAKVTDYVGRIAADAASQIGNA